MILFLHGEDSFLVHRQQNTFRQAFVNKYPTGEVFVFDFEDQREQSDIMQGLASCETGLFATKKMIFFLHPSVLDESKEKYIIDFLHNFSERRSEDITVCFVEPRKIKKTQDIIKALLKYTDEEIPFPKKEIKDIGMYIKKELSLINKKVQFSYEALMLFVKLVQGDTARIQNELEKLSAYKTEGILEKEDILLLIEESKEEVIFEALDALGNGKRSQALLLFHKQASSKDGIYSLFGMCAGQVRRMLLIREMIEQGIRRESEIASHTKIHPFVVKRVLHIIEHFSLERIKRGIKLLSDLDSDVKQGKKDPLIALDFFLWKF